MHKLNSQQAKFSEFEQLEDFDRKCQYFRKTYFHIFKARDLIFYIQAILHLNLTLCENRLAENYFYVELVKGQ